MLRRLRHFLRLVREFASYTVVNRAWWVLPMMAMLTAITIFIVVGQAAAPYTLYTVF